MPLDTPCWQFQLEIQARGHGYMVHSSMEQDFTMVVEQVLERIPGTRDFRFRSLEARLFDYRGLVRLDEGLL